MTLSEIPSHQHNVYLHDPGHTHSYNYPDASVHQDGTQSADVFFNPSSHTTGTSVTGVTIGSVNGVANDNKTDAQGGGAAHVIVQPTIVCNYIIRII